MSESTTELAGPSLEDILWRAMDRFAEEPAVLDAEEFAAHIAGAFSGELPEEAFVERFIEGNPELARKADMAEAIVRSTASRLHVYQFDLDHLDYVVIGGARGLLERVELDQLRSSVGVLRAGDLLDLELMKGVPRLQARCCSARLALTRCQVLPPLSERNSPPFSASIRA